MRADEALTRLASAAGQVEDYLIEVATQAMTAALAGDDSGRTILSITAVSGQPDMIRRYVARLAVERQGIPLGQISAERFGALAEMLAGAGPRAVSLPAGFVARRQRDQVIISPAQQSEAEQPEAVTLNCPGRTEVGRGRVISCRIEPLDRDSFDKHRLGKNEGVEFIDADQLSGPLTCRPRRPGDLFQPLGCGGRQSVGDFLTNQKVPRRLRERVRCICDGLGIIYVAPIRIDERVKVTPQTAKVLQIAGPGLSSFER